MRVLLLALALTACTRDPLAGVDIGAVANDMVAKQERLRAEGAAGDMQRAVEALQQLPRLLEDCVRFARERDPNVAGRVVVLVTFGGGGVVDARTPSLVSVPTNETGDAKYGLCVSAASYGVAMSDEPVAPPTQATAALVLTKGRNELVFER